MRSGVCGIVAALALGGVAQAQSAATASRSADRGYAEFVAQSAFGNVTSQSYGGEIGFTVVPHLQVFVEAGKTRDVATPEISAAAQAIAGGLTLLEPRVNGQPVVVGYSVKEPVTFFAAGMRYLPAMVGAKAQPYVMGGFGGAKVSQNVAFTVGGTDVTGTLPQFGVVLGTDLSGELTSPLLILGGGVTYPLWTRVILDFQLRFGRIFAEETPINVTRAGIGVGLRF